MPHTALTGSRIRARRLDLGIKQADLAERLGISPSYLNLIEHNRRRIAGMLLSQAARALSTEVSTLAKGAESALIEGLRDAAAAAPDATPDMARAEDFAGRFPDWAALIVAQARRIAALERAVETLSDRMTHDPFLSESLHDVLSTVTAIRSTSGILIDDGEIDPEWRARFHRNLFEDSRRLAESAQGLVGYLDAEGQADTTIAAPQDEVDAWLERQGYHLSPLETGAAPESVLPDGVSSSAHELMLAFATQYRADAQAVPLADLREALATGGDPGHLAQRFHTDLHRIMRRLACLPEGLNGRPVGLVLCDASGTLTFRKPIEGFALPRYGAACPLWPLYQAVARPHTPIRQVVQHTGQMAPRFTCFAMAQQVHAGGFDTPPVLTSAMLILPLDGDAPGQTIGTSCRICPRSACAARREPSIVAMHSN